MIPQRVVVSRLGVWKPTFSQSDMSRKSLAQLRLFSLPQSPAHQVIGLIAADEVDSHALRAAVRKLGAAQRRGRSLGGAMLERLGLGVSMSEAALALIQRWPELDPGDQHVAAMTLAEPLRGAAVVLARSSEVQDRVAAARALGVCLSGQGIGELGRLACDADPEVREAAGAALESLVRRPRLNDELEAALDSQLAAIADGVDIAPDRLVLAPSLLRLTSPGPKLRAVLEDDGHPAHLVWRALIRRPQIRLSGGDLIRLLKVDVVAPAAMDAISGAAPAHRVKELCEASHLLLNPARLQRIHRHDAGKRLSGMRDRVFEVMRAGEHGAARLLFLCERLAKPVRTQSPIQWTQLTDGAARRLAIAHARRSGLSREQARAAGVAFASDGDARVARSALLNIADDLAPEAREAVESLVSSRHRACARIAREAIARRDAACALRGADAFSNFVSLRRALHRDRDGAVAMLRSGITRGEADQRMRAIRAAGRVGVAPECELELLATLAEDDPFLVSAALMTLAEVDSHSVDDAIDACLQHEDGRVRANAIEATARRNRALVLDNAITSECARERCNAAHILSVRVEPKLAAQGKEILTSMLTDERPEHRLSGLWLVARLGRTECASMVASIAAEDPDQRIRMRARATARRLLAEMSAETAAVGIAS